jgi:protein O-mannosyl-transferase
MVLIFQRWRRWDRVPAFIVCLGVLSVLGILSWKQSRIYVDAESLYRATIERNPDAWMAQNNLAGVLIERGAAQ